MPRVDEPVRHAYEDAREGLLQHDIRELHGEDREGQAVGARRRLAARESEASEKELQRREERPARCERIAAMAWGSVASRLDAIDARSKVEGHRASTRRASRYTT